MMFLYVEPQAGLRPLLALLRGAHQRIEIEAYYVSSRPFLEALHAAIRRGVRVRVILDRTPWGIPRWRVRREARLLREMGARVRWAPARFERRRGWIAFEHAKYLCADSVCEVGTANYDASAFRDNREYLLVTSRRSIVTALQQVFAADWRGAYAPRWVHRVLVLSPGGSLGPILRTVDQPGRVDIETEELGDDHAVLAALARRGDEVRILLPRRLSAEDRRVASRLSRKGVCVRLLPRHPLYLHAKMVVGHLVGFVGSENFTWTSLERNREVGLLVRGAILRRLRQVFDHDWRRGHPLASCP